MGVKFHLCQSINHYFCVRLKVDQRASQLSLPHVRTYSGSQHSASEIISAIWLA